jgi:hypothetical protein
VEGVTELQKRIQRRAVLTYLNIVHVVLGWSCFEGHIYLQDTQLLSFLPQALSATLDLGIYQSLILYILVIYPIVCIITASYVDKYTN